MIRAVSLKTAIVVPFVILMVLAVGLTGLLSVLNGRVAVEEVVSSLLAEITERIEDNLRHFLEAPYRVDAINRMAVRTGLLSTSDLTPWRKYLWRQAQLAVSVNNIVLGNEAGAYVGVDTPASGQRVIQISDATTGFDLITYQTDAAGRLTEQLSVARDYDPRKRPWYRSPVAAGGPVWSSIYKHFVDPALQMALSMPLYDESGSLLGVTAAAVRLSRIADFLKTLRIGTSGEAFIVDRSGLLVAASVPETPFRITEAGQAERIAAGDSRHPLIRAVAGAVDFSEAGPPANGDWDNRRVTVDNAAHFVRITPFGDPCGLDWRVVVVVPESDFLAKIHQNTRTTIYLCVAWLLAAILCGLIISRWVTRPILRLNASARSLAAGWWTERVTVSRQDEIGELAWSFNRMAAALQSSLESLQAEVDERRAAEDELGRIFGMSIDLICIADIKTATFVKVNPAFTDTLGFSPAELLGRPFFDFIHPDDLELTRRVMAEKLEAGEKVIDFENRYRCRDGSYRWLSWVSHPDPDAGMTYAIARDITEAKAAEQALADSEEKYRGIFENAVVGFFQSTPEGRFVTLNPAFAEMFGYDSPEAMIAAISDIATQYYCDPDDRRRYKERLQTVGSVEHFEFRARRRDGTPIWISNSTRGCYDDAGELIRYEGVVIDITERKQAEAALIDSQRRFEQLARQSRTYTWEVDPEGRYTQVSRMVESVLGYGPDELVGHRTFYDIRTENERDSFAGPVAEAIESRTAIRNLVSPVRAKDGRIVWISTSAIPLTDEAGTLAGFWGTDMDVTERKQAEIEREALEDQLRQAQKMEAVGRLAGGVAHDFNNNLTVILGHTEMALTTLPETDPLHQRLLEIQKAGQRSASLTGQLLAFARKQTVAPSILSLNDAVEELLKMLKRLIGEDIDLLWHPSDELWPVRMDPGQVNQILANLAVNARDAIAGVGKLTIETHNATFDADYCRTHSGFLPGDYVTLQVSDNGCGMDAETLEWLFEPFFTTKELGKGTGLGLATVYGIVKQNRGFINVYSEPGAGTTFKIYLPRHLSGDATPVSAPSPEAAIPGGTETVLLVEDDRAVMQLAAMLLRDLGYTVIRAGTPREAVRQAEGLDGEIHLLMTDVIMPEMSGRELQQRLSRDRPEMRCLFMSGYTANVIAHQGILYDDVCFLQKPFSKEALAAKLREALTRDPPER